MSDLSPGHEATEPAGTLGRRRLLKLLTAGGVTAAAQLMPVHWDGASLQLGVLPAHAACTHPGVVSVSGPSWVEDPPGQLNFTMDVSVEEGMQAGTIGQGQRKLPGEQGFRNEGPRSDLTLPEWTFSVDIGADPVGTQYRVMATPRLKKGGVCVNGTPTASVTYTKE